MEKPSSFDINIRNVDVRLKDSLKGTNVNGDCDNSIYISANPDSENKLAHYNEMCNDHSTENLAELTSDIREKLHICKDSKNCNLLNGCRLNLHEDMKRLDKVNGISKCSGLEILNSHLDKLSFRTYESSTNCSENARTSIESNEENSTSIETNSSCLSPESSTFIKVDDCGGKLDANCDAQDANTEIAAIVSNPSSEILSDVNITYLGYDSESQMPDIMRLIQKDLSEPYSIYTYRYFIHNWPKLCFLAQYENHCVGAIVCKLDVHKKQSRRGYIAMLAVDEKYRKRKIGSNLVLKAIHAMVEDNADEVVLETEITNRPALKLYENLGFVRDKRLFRYYLNGVDALRLKLWLR